MILLGLKRFTLSFKSTFVCTMPPRQPDGSSISSKEIWVYLGVRDAPNQKNTSFVNAYLPAKNESDLSYISSKNPPI